MPQPVAQVAADVRAQDGDGAVVVTTDDDAAREGDAAVVRHVVRLQVQGDVAVIGRVLRARTAARGCHDGGEPSQLEPLIHAAGAARVGPRRPASHEGGIEYRPPPVARGRRRRRRGYITFV